MRLSTVPGVWETRETGVGTRTGAEDWGQGPEVTLISDDTGQDTGDTQGTSL